VRRRRRDLRWLVPVVVLVGAVVIGSLLVRDAQEQDRSAPLPPPTDPDRFTLESDDGVLTFDRDGDRTRLEFEGADESGVFGFDPEGEGGAEAQGDTGTFELTPGEPPGWPAGFPVPYWAAVQRGSVVDAGALVQLSATYAVAASAAEVLAFYRERLAGDDPIVDVEPTPEGVEVTQVSFEGDPSGFVSITPTPQGSLLVVQLLIVPPADDLD
jgi:hypothetical protein